MMSAADGGASAWAAPLPSVSAKPRVTMTMALLVFMRDLLDVAERIDDLEPRSAIRGDEGGERRDRDQQQPRTHEQPGPPRRQHLERNRRSCRRRRPPCARVVEENGDELAQRHADGRAERPEERARDDEQAAHAGALQAD